MPILKEEKMLVAVVFLLLPSVIVAKQYDAKCHANYTVSAGCKEVHMTWFVGYTPDKLEKFTKSAVGILKQRDKYYSHVHRASIYTPYDCFNGFSHKGVIFSCTNVILVGHTLVPIADTEQVL